MNTVITINIDNEERMAILHLLEEVEIPSYYRMKEQYALAKDVLRRATKVTLKRYQKTTIIVSDAELKSIDVILREFGCFAAEGATMSKGSRVLKVLERINDTRDHSKWLANYKSDGRSISCNLSE